MMKLTLVAAMSLNRVIGNKGQLPWRLPADLARFKRLTMNHAVIMGRKTFDSIRTPLPGRSNIGTTRQRDWTAPSGGVIVAHDFHEAMAQAKQLDESIHHQDEFMILGGADIYHQAMPLADTIQLTVVESSFEGDAFFPEIDTAEWRLTLDDPHSPDDRNRTAYRFQEWMKSKVDS